MPLRDFITAIFFVLIFTLPACNRDQSEKIPSEGNQKGSIQKNIIKPGCRSCHPFTLDPDHAELSCTSCHNGNSSTADPEEAHFGLISRPADPANMGEKCGNCHQETDTVYRSRHFTLKNEVNLVRRHFGADQDLANLLDIPISETPETPLELADDLLRRRCLRCHVYYPGDEYSKVEHGTGCAACHLEYEDGKPITHRFTALPPDTICLSCHYGNRVGSDYYGRFDHDFKHEYRTPYQPDGYYPPRPYAMEQHRLAPDIHQIAGMTCVDCHLEMHGDTTMKTISCTGCHLNQKERSTNAPHLVAESGEFTFVTRRKGIKLAVPQATGPIHNKYKNKAACTVCHAQWSYSDTDTHLLRIDHEEYDDWDELYVQDNSEVELIILNSIYGDEIIAPVMSDKITGRLKQGLWMKGFKIRRWADPIIDFDQHGKLQVMRPALDLQLSWVDVDEETIFDSVTGDTNTMRPYTPHTIGKAGAFYHKRIIKLTSR